MSENNGVPVGEVENIPLSLKNWHEKGGGEIVSIQKPSQVDSPVLQIFRDPFRQNGSSVG